MKKEGKFNFGLFELPSEILDILFFDGYIEFQCLDGSYKAYKNKRGTSCIKKLESVTINEQ